MPGPSRAQRDGERAPDQDRITIYVPRATALALHRLAAALDTNRNALIRAAIARFLEDQATP